MPPPASRPDPESSAPDAATLFERFLDAIEAGDEPDFAALLAEHPEQAAALSLLHERWERLDTAMDQLMPAALAEESYFHALMSARESLGPAPALQRRHAGEVLGDYRLLRRLGGGAMGEVWEAEQLSLRRRVAFKLLRPEQASAERAHQLAEEARAGGCLDHPGIVTVYAAGEIEGVPYIAQQLVGDGLTLADVLTHLRRRETRRPQHDRRMARLLLDVASAMQAAHAAGILHRDLKPSNILIGTDDRPRVSDFGLAVALHDLPAGHPGLVGTCAYMSPEQASGSEGAIDRRSDVFSLGAVLYEALTLQRAFPGEAAVDVLRRVVEEVPPDARKLQPTLPADLAVICSKALEKRRADRYQDMAALADDLRRFLAHEPIRAAPPGALGRLRRWVVRHPAWSTAASLGSLLLLLVSLALLREVDLRLTAERASSRADQSAESARATATIARVREQGALLASYIANVHAAALNLERGEPIEARLRLASCPSELRGWEWDHLALRADTSRLHLQRHDAPVSSLAVTPDGGLVFSAALDGTLGLWDGRSGRRLHTFGSPEERGRARSAVRSVAISADGWTLLSGGDDGLVHVWDPTDGQERLWDTTEGQESLVLMGHRAGVAAVGCSGDGTLVVSGSDDGIVHVTDLRADEMYELVAPRGSAVRSLAVSADGRRFAVGTRSGSVGLWDAASGQSLLEFVSVGLGEARVALDATGSQLFIADVSGRVRCYPIEAAPSAVRAGEPQAPEAALVDARSSADEVGEQPAAVDPVETIEGPGGPVDALACDAAGDVLLVAAGGRVLLVDRAGHRRALPTGVGGAVTAVALSADGRCLLAGADDGDTCLWDVGLAGARELVLTSGVRPAPTCLALADGGRTIVCAALQRPEISVYDGSGTLRRLLHGHMAGISDVAVSADGRRVASASYDGVVRLWDGESGSPLGLVGGHVAGATALDLTSDGAWLASGDPLGQVRVWRWPAQDVTVRTAPGLQRVTQVAIAPDGRRVVAGDERGTVVLWEGADPARVLRRGPGFDDGLLALSRHGEVLVRAGARDDSFARWDFASGQHWSARLGVREGLAALSLAPDGRRLFGASWRDSLVRVWDVDSARPLAFLAGHEGHVTAAAISPDGSRLVTAGSDGVLRAWETAASLAGAGSSR